MRGSFKGMQVPIEIENNDSLKSNDDGTDSFQVNHIIVESIRVVHRKAES